MPPFMRYIARFYHKNYFYSDFHVFELLKMLRLFANFKDLN